MLLGYVYIHATLTGYAYETTAGKSIKAGQTKGAADQWDEEGFGTGASVMSPISDTSQVVGCVSNDANSCSAAFLWEDGQMVDLNTLIPPNSSLQLQFASNVNDQGEILGEGLPNGCSSSDLCGHLFLLIPCDDNHDNGDCGEHGEGAAATALSSSAPVTQNPTAMTVDNLSARARMGSLHGRLGRGYQRVVPQSRNASKAEADYITDEMPLKLSGHCVVDLSRRYIGDCEGSCSTHHWDPVHCPPGKRAKQFKQYCGGLHFVDPTRRCSLQ